MAESDVRAETIGSLLRPREILDARRALRGGETTEADVQRLEDAAVVDSIRLQEDAGLDVITDGELRRRNYIVTIESLDGFTFVRGGSSPIGWKGTEDSERWNALPFPVVVEEIRPNRDLAQREYRFLRENAHVRTKYTLPAPSLHWNMWHADQSTGAYPTEERFLHAVRDYLRSVIEDLVALDCDYIQLDAPNYGVLCDPDAAGFLESEGRDLARDLAFYADLDNSVVQDLPGVTTAMHVCRGNAAGAWQASGGYDAIAGDLFPRLRFDRLLLEYDTPRAGDFGALQQIGAGTGVALGLITTKGGELEDPAAVEARVREASSIVPLERLGLSPQCGFASVEVGNPLSPGEQEAKIRLVADVAKTIWGE